MHLLSGSFALIILAASFQLTYTFNFFDESHHKDSNYLYNITSEVQEVELRKRDGNCPLNFNSCSTLAEKFGGACCAEGSLCTTDGAHQIACCTTGAKCTGTLDRPTFTTTAADMGFSPAMTITSSTDAYSTPTMTASVVNNIYFPFPYSPTSFPDKESCQSALNACHKNYDACTANLQGASYGVTIIAPAGGITVAPTAPNLGVSSATKICSSLSSQACYDISNDDCNQFRSTFSPSTDEGAASKFATGFLAVAGMLVAMGWEITRRVV